MIEKKKHFLAAKATGAILMALSMMTAKISHAGIPVIDGGNLIQNITTALENVAQTAKQIEQYKSQLDQYKAQLQQYDNQIQNTNGQSSFIWDQTRQTMSNLNNSINTLNFYKNQLGSIDSYLGKFQDVDYYKNSPCFTASGCSDAARASLLASQQTYQSQSQKKANDALFRGLDQQQSSLESDGQQLQRLQSIVQGSDGQVKAIQSAAMIASHQSNQLMQIRALLIAQQNSAATRAQALNDLDAMQSAATAQARGGKYTRSPAKSW